MNDISNIYSNVGASYATGESKKTEANEVSKKSNVPGKTVGEPKLSDKALKYYEDLRKKFHNMEFILVSKEEKENAKQNAAAYASNNKMVVLIDEEKIERMAEDSKFRSQYEGIIEKAATGLSKFEESIKATGANVKGYGMQVNDNGTTSLFAVLEKSSADQAKRIAKKRAQNKEEAKEAAKEQAEKRLEKAKEAKKSDSEDVKEISDNDVVIRANSFDELLRKIEDYVQIEKSDNVVTESEKSLGQNIDFSA